VKRTIYSFRFCSLEPQAHSNPDAAPVPMAVGRSCIHRSTSTWPRLQQSRRPLTFWSSPAQQHCDHQPSFGLLDHCRRVPGHYRYRSMDNDHRRQHSGHDDGSSEYGLSRLLERDEVGYQINAEHLRNYSSRHRLVGIWQDSCWLPLFRVVWGPSRIEKVWWRETKQIFELKTYPNKSVGTGEVAERTLSGPEHLRTFANLQAKMPINMEYPADGEYAECMEFPTTNR
jgi:hypothetical protein